MNIWLGHKGIRIDEKFIRMHLGQGIQERTEYRFNWVLGYITSVF